MISIPYIFLQQENGNEQTIFLYSECVKKLLKTKTSFTKEIPFLNLKDCKITKQSHFDPSLKDGPEIHCSVELQAFDYHQPNYKNFYFKKYKLYAGYAFPIIDELKYLDNFKIYDYPFKVIRDKETFLTEEKKWISFYSIFYLNTEEIKILINNGKTKIFFSEEAWSYLFIALLNFFESLGIEKNILDKNVSFVGGASNDVENELSGKYHSCPIAMFHPTYYIGNEDYFDRINANGYNKTQKLDIPNTDDLLNDFLQRDVKNAQEEVDNTIKSIHAYNNQFIEKDILYLVRKPRPHRYIPLCVLLENGGLDNHAITFPKIDEQFNYLNLHNGKTTKNMQTMDSHFNKIFGVNNKHVYEKYKHLSHLEINFPLTSEFATHQEINTISWTTMCEPHIDNFIYTKISVIGETLGFNNENPYHYPSGKNYVINLLSEKTGRCLLYGHPFTIVSTINTLKSLKKLGFCTFSDFLDESYDSVGTDTERFELATKSALNFVKNYKNIDKIHLYEILKYNNNYYKKDFVFSIFKKIYES